MRAAARHPLVRLAIANVGYAQAMYLSLLIILPDRAAAVGGHAGKTLVLAAVAAAGAVIALPSGIAVGRVSDQRLRLTGSRRPVLAVVAGLGAVLLAVLPFTRSTGSLLLAWCGAQAGLNGVFVLVTAALVDWFASDHRGRASAYAATGQVAGAVIASVLAVTMGSHTEVAAAVSGVLLLCTALPAAFHRHTAPSAPPGGHLRPHAPARGGYRDAGLAWAVRAVVTFANTLVFTFANFYVSDVLHLRDPQRFVGLAAGLTSALVLAGAIYSGRSSDRSKRRRRYVIRAVMIMCLGELLLAAWPDARVVLAACAIFGFGYGVYLAVDQALTADVLPDARRFGRDIGIMNASISAPQVAAPALAVVLLGASASYDVLFSVGALITLSGAAFVVPIRRVR